MILLIPSAVAKFKMEAQLNHNKPCSDPKVKACDSH